MVVFHIDIINAIAQARNIRHLLASDILERWQQGEEATPDQAQSLIQLGNWIDFLTDSEQLVVDGCIDSTDVWNIIQQIGEQAIGLDCVGTNYSYNNPPPVPNVNILNYVQSVNGLNTNNTDPQNPIVRISVDGLTITGNGTPASPLIATAPLGGVQSVTGNLVNNANPENPVVNSPLTPDELAAIQGANAPSGANVFATMADILVGAATNLGYTVSPTDGTVTSSTGTDATLPLADGTNAGLLKPSHFSVLENENQADGYVGTDANNEMLSGYYIEQLSVVAAQTLIAGSDLVSLKAYILDDADAGNRIIKVLAAAGVTNQFYQYAIDATTGEIGTYDINTDVFSTVSGIPDLQQVTTVNATTSVGITVDNGTESVVIKHDQIKIVNASSAEAVIISPTLATTTNFEIPNKAGGTETFAMLSDIGGGITKATAAGTDTYTTTISGVAAYVDGDTYLIRFTNGNTTAATLNINSLGAKSLYRNNDGIIIGGDIWAGAEMLCVFNSFLNGFQCIGTSPNSLFAYVVNADSVAITRGQPVYAFGSTGNRMSVKLAYNTTDATSAQTYGLVYSTSIAANQKGIIIIQGVLDGLNLGGTWVDGDPVYLGTTAGTITKTKQYAPNHLVYLGVVERANAGNGIMYVRVQNGYELDELHNVQAQSPSLKDTLWYDNAVSPAQWKTASISTILGYTPISATSTDTLTNKRITARSGTVASAATPTINTDNVDFFSITGQLVDITNMSTNLTGVPTEGQTLWIAITGTAARAINWGTSFEASTIALPTTTVTTARLDVAFIYNTVTSRWRCVGTC